MVAKIWDYYKKLKLYFIDYKIYMLKEPRSDIMKKLTYSRQTVNNCSVINNTHDLGTRLLSCTRVEDEIIPPVNTSQMTFNNQTFPGYCYGIELGEDSNPSLSLTDNWFCADEYSKNPTINNNPIYNIQK